MFEKYIVFFLMAIFWNSTLQGNVIALMLFTTMSMKNTAKHLCGWKPKLYFLKLNRNIIFSDQILMTQFRGNFLLQKFIFTENILNS